MNHRRSGKIFALTLLLLGILALGASTAHAEWLVLRNKSSVSSLTSTMSLSTGRLLVPELELDIFCLFGEGEMSAQLSSSDTVMSGKATIEFNLCEELTFGEVCEVRSTGEQAETIVLSMALKAGMLGGTTYLDADASSEDKFTIIEFIGEECPLTEIDGTVTGTMRFEIKEPLSESVVHNFELTSQDLEFGGTNAKLHEGLGGWPLSGLMIDWGSLPMSLHLVGL